jgi:hypothetical protein
MVLSERSTKVIDTLCFGLSMRLSRRIKSDSDVTPMYSLMSDVEVIWNALRYPQNLGCRTRWAAYSPSSSLERGTDRPSASVLSIVKLGSFLPVSISERYPLFIARRSAISTWDHLFSILSARIRFPSFDLISCGTHPSWLEVYDILYAIADRAPNLSTGRGSGSPRELRGQSPTVVEKV